MRFLLLATLGLVGPALAVEEAQACPGRTACLARTAVEIDTISAAGAPRATVSTALARPRLRALDLRLTTTFDLEPAPAATLLSFDPMPDALPIPRDAAALFAQAARKVDSTMPSVRRPTYQVMASPVIVAGTFDTVPGVGVSGAF